MGTKWGPSATEMGTKKRVNATCLISRQMGTNVGAVLGSVSDESDNYLCCLVISLYLCFDIREKGPNAFQEFQSCLFSMPQ